MDVDANTEGNFPAKSPTVQRDFVLLFASMFSLLAGAALSPALPEMAAHFKTVENIETLVKMTLSLTALCIAIGSSLTGIVVDRVGRKTVLVAGIVLTGIAGTSGALLDSIYQILASRVLLGLGVAFVITSATTLIGDLFSPAEQARFFGLQAAAMKAGGIVFLFLGAALATVGWRASFLVDLLAFLILPSVISAIPSGTARRHAHSDQSSLRANSTLIASLFAAFVSQLAFYMVPTQLPFQLVQLVHANPAMIGAAVAANIAASALSASQFHRLSRLMSNGTIYVFSFIVMALGYTTIAYAEDFWQILVALVVGGLGLGAIFPCASSSVTRAVDTSQRGRAVGLLMMATFAGQFCSPLVTAPVVAHVGINGAFLRIAAVLVLAGIILHLALRRRR